MSGFGAFVRGVRADVASRRDARRSATEDAATTTGAARAPFLSTRLKPISDARKLWASATQSRLGVETSFSGGSDRVAFVTEPRTGLKLPGARRSRRPRRVVVVVVAAAASAAARSSVSR
ncbi:uncharacterized protein MICPUCDRAFT_57971 [Micromonas pusilla CCMP1545]|uniref:Predicted protein n=1 Tax=Micromonas pusilla (strain CCMP1545) TaxID=564608 RepID=C1MT84_MICPC|nr:uncharacterized protein MICPUCDRAFT_57971 [Micromonas pusilla CCMP1545]EEH56898.1 predicted protein [Micromonas pusilla CCMP1545]|eukprot:XP_003058443.1 predicted protein [Micromonas pusilla CCMP1545]